MCHLHFIAGAWKGIVATAACRNYMDVSSTLSLLYLHFLFLILSQYFTLFTGYLIILIGQK